jgi:hypothetical protein
MRPFTFKTYTIIEGSSTTDLQKKLNDEIKTGAELEPNSFTVYHNGHSTSFYCMVYRLIKSNV